MKINFKILLTLKTAAHVQALLEDLICRREIVGRNIYAFVV